ncbi:MAG: acetyl-CoA carboxylase carboxyl transferase subunit alpha, partial [Planctomycetaceae bacterium]|nr:acetyl-CoA carboxylase carboxyl transferase subunit alpha [Planctomycetaceae bacterium]
MFELETQLEKLEEQPNPSATTKDAIRTMRTELNRLKREVYEQLGPWDIVR